MKRKILGSKLLLCMGLLAAHVFSVPSADGQAQPPTTCTNGSFPGTETLYVAGITASGAGPSSSTGEIVPFDDTSSANTPLCTIGPLTPAPWKIVNAPNNSISLVTTLTSTLYTLTGSGGGIFTLSNAGGGAVSTGQVAITPDGTQAFITDSALSAVYVIGTAQLTGANPIPVTVVPGTGSVPADSWITISPDGQYVLVDGPNGSVEVITTATAPPSVIATLPAPTGIGSSGSGPLAITPDGLTLYIAYPGAGLGYVSLPAITPENPPAPTFLSFTSLQIPVVAPGAFPVTPNISSISPSPDGTTLYVEWGYAGLAGVHPGLNGVAVITSPETTPVVQPSLTITNGSTTGIGNGDILSNLSSTFALAVNNSGGSAIDVGEVSPTAVLSSDSFTFPGTTVTGIAVESSANCTLNVTGSSAGVLTVPAGQSVSANLTCTADSAHSLVGSINWGDGTTNVSPAVVEPTYSNFQPPTITLTFPTHVYTAPSTSLMLITATVQDTTNELGGSVAPAVDAFVTPVAPICSFTSVSPNPVSSNGVVTATIACSTPTTDALTGTVTWGDGNVSQVAGTAVGTPGSATLTATHSYARAVAGGYQVSASIVDNTEDESTAQFSASPRVTVTFPFSCALSASPTSNIANGTTVTAMLACTGQASDAVSASFAWGDGTNSSISTAAANPNGLSSLSATHVYTTSGTITPTVTDAAAGATATVSPASVPVTVQTVAVTLTPGSVTVNAGQQVQFSAGVTGTSNTAVTWQVNSVTNGNATFGTISSGGLYTAPAAVPSPATFAIKATSVADPTKSASANVTVSSASTSPVSVTISPMATTVAAGTTVQFTAMVQNAGTSTAVTWQASGAGTINSSSGLYTAPATVPASPNVTVTATSVADPTKSSSVTFALAGDGLVIQGTLTGITVSLGASTPLGLQLITSPGSTPATFTLSCAMPAGSGLGCKCSPNTATSNGSSPVNFTLTVFAPSSTAAVYRFPALPQYPLKVLLVSILGLFFTLFWVQTAYGGRKRQAFVLLALVCFSIVFMASCSGISQSPSVSAPAVTQPALGALQAPAVVTATPAAGSPGIYVVSQLPVPLTVTQ